MNKLMNKRHQTLNLKRRLF